MCLHIVQVLPHLLPYLSQACILGILPAIAIVDCVKGLSKLSYPPFHGQERKVWVQFAEVVARDARSLRPYHVVAAVHGFTALEGYRKHSPSNSALWDELSHAVATTSATLKPKQVAMCVNSFGKVGIPNPSVWQAL